MIVNATKYHTYAPIPSDKIDFRVQSNKLMPLTKSGNCIPHRIVISKKRM